MNYYGFFLLLPLMIFIKEKIPYINLILLWFTFSLPSCLISRIDRTPYQQNGYYKRLDKQLSSFTIDSLQVQGDTIRAGWAKVNITPSYPVALAGYGSRKGKEFTSVNDSIWVRAFVFSNGKQKVALVNLDMLIVPPLVVKALQEKLPAIGFTIGHTYLTATHTHNSIGGWAKKMVGRLIAGKYQEKVVQDLSNQIVRAIQQADQNKQIAQFGFAKYDKDSLVNNRITGAAGYTDPWLRVLKIKQASGKTAIITSFAAHATCLSSKDYALSRDYPGALVDSLEKHPEIDFAAYCAGGVGSHSPAGGGNNYKQIIYMARQLTQTVFAHIDSIPLTYQKELVSVHIPLPLSKPQWRISDNWYLRPWLFFALYGRDYNSSLTALKIGNVTWAGTPCDFSGELIPLIEKKLSGNDHVIVTSFNGGYIGYITHDAHFDTNHYETRAMSWFGPQNGAYLVESISRLLNKL